MEIYNGEVTLCTCHAHCSSFGNGYKECKVDEVKTQQFGICVCLCVFLFFSLEMSVKCSKEYT